MSLKGHRTSVEQQFKIQPRICGAIDLPFSNKLLSKPGKFKSIF